MTEFELLQQEVKELRSIINAFVLTDKYVIGKDLKINDGRNIVVARGTGTTIGTEITQKLSFWNLTPIIQPSTTGETIGASDADVLNTTTFNGNNGSSAYTIGDIVKHLKNLGLLKK